MASGEVLGLVPGIWDELAAGTPETDAPVGVMAHPDGICRTAGYVTRSPVVWEGGGREAPPYPDCYDFQCQEWSADG